jgi:nucleoid-associated protein YgaU
MEIPRQSSDRSKHHKVVEGEQLWMISNNEYEDPANWREIAEANNIDNPLALETGKTIKVPRLY